MKSVLLRATTSDSPASSCVALGKLKPMPALKL
jgi:hypothetical protein